MRFRGAKPKGSAPSRGGQFAFGGSCVITLWQHGRIRFDADIGGQSAPCLETYARMGDRLGEAP
jgi:phosphatidylserine decarboxylase